MTRKKIGISIGLAAAASILAGTAYASASEHDRELHKSFSQARTPMTSARLTGGSPMPFNAEKRSDGTIRIVAYGGSTKSQQHMLVPDAIQSNFVSTARVMADDYPAEFIKTMQDGAYLRYEGTTRCESDRIEWNTVEAVIDIESPAASSIPLFPKIKAAFEKNRPTPAAMALICEEASRS